ncbi:DUF58 domain-containing protein [Thermaerobacillus caldiproteolyticus]|uniref:Uncharacterized protein (DUF58 family) n=1 Tax=Thermaerobacillus caldiproteolyticus TaxID=247480 RepID=A0A7V9ZA79_9BACL|nr:DUF58 domain-containing protein [Anoxybacillus caldiproteolyticus]MBA2876892.1 uncharacterized protein (DUF58 family) [Anoxybacillus caldiproteolyticus]
MMKQKIRFVRQVVFIVCLFGILFSYAMFQGGFVSWFLFYSFLPFGLYSLTIVFYPLHKLKIVRIVNQQQYHAGDRFNVTIQMTAPIFFPIVYIIAEDEWPPSIQMHYQRQNAKTILSPLWKKEFSWTYELRELPRGEHVFSTIRLKMTDFFGLVEKEVTYSAENTILVYPRYIEMTYRKVGQRFDQGVTASPLLLHRDMTIAVGVREYAQGDRFSWIHWKASARKNELMTKDFEERQSEDLIVFLNRTPTPLFEDMVTFSASLIRAAIKKGVQTGFVSVGSDRVIFPARDGEAHLHRLFYYLAKVTCDGSEPFARIIQKEIMQWPAAFSFCYVTSSLDKELISVLSDVASRNRYGTVFLIKDQETCLSKEERGMIEQLRRRGVVTIVTERRNFADALVKGGK